LPAGADCGQGSLNEARDIMQAIDAKSSALLAALAIFPVTAALDFSLDQCWLSQNLMFALVGAISVAILFLLRCLIHEPGSRLRHVFEMPEVESSFARRSGRCVISTG
jgi:hypothetical protein